MKTTFNKRRFWLAVVMVCLIEVLATVLVKRWDYIFPAGTVSEFYARYAGREDLEVSFIKDFRLNDSVSVDVTVVEARTDSAWRSLMEGFGMSEQMIDFYYSHPEIYGKDRKTQIRFFLDRNKRTADGEFDYESNPYVIASPCRSTFSVFHIVSERQFLGVTASEIKKITE